MKRIREKLRRRKRRKLSIRKNIFGTETVPRITVFKSNRYTYVQAIDDNSAKTIAAVSNLEKEHRAVKNNVREVGKLGETIGARLKELDIKQAVFDRNGYLFHGIVKAVADGIRKSGVKF
jgi:large subunit ribosomal protein L18